MLRRQRAQVQYVCDATANMFTQLILHHKEPFPPAAAASHPDRHKAYILTKENKYIFCIPCCPLQFLRNKILFCKCI